MKIIQARELQKGQQVLVDGKPAAFVALHQVQHCPGRYGFRALVDRFEAGRIREVSVRVAELSLPAVAQ